MGMGWVLYSTKWVKSVLYREPQHKTQPQHTTTNMSCRRSTLQQHWPSLSKGRLSAPPTNGAAASYVPRKAPMVRFGDAMADFPVWGATKRCIKKQRDKWGSGLRWPPFDDGTQ
jgi:hypothetical protein